MLGNIYITCNCHGSCYVCNLAILLFIKLKYFMSTLSKIGIVLLATIIFILLLPFIFIIGFVVVVSAYCMVVKEFLTKPAYERDTEDC